MDAAIVVDRLRVVRGGNVVLPELSVDVRAGSVTGLLGPSGSGKTTLIRAIVGVQQIASGHVHVLGRRAGSPVLRGQVAYVTQAPSVYADITVLDNLNYFARILDVGRAEIDEAIDSVSLGGFDGRVVGTLSDGQRARVSLATALLHDPDLLVLDEPTVGLDPVLRRDLWRSFRALADEGATLLVSSHVMDEAAHCDDLVLLREGRLVAHEPPAELLRRAHTDDMDEAFLRIAEQQDVGAE
jgi:ABC-2 type transport system ATP-binding protein